MLHFEPFLRLIEQVFPSLFPQLVCTEPFVISKYPVFGFEYGTLEAKYGHLSVPARLTLNIFSGAYESRSGQPESCNRLN